MKPIIGITAAIEKEHKSMLNNNYVQAIIQAGGLPIILPADVEKDIEQLVTIVDGLLLTGGGDIDPELFDEDPHSKLGEISPSRDIFEIELTKEMLKLNKPILGICRGLQILTVVFGGNLFQDIHSIHTKTLLLQHMQQAPRSHPSHFIEVEENSLLESIAKSTRFKVNSFHHQSAKHVPKSLIVSAKTSDGIIESIESPAHRFVMGVQWHPEALAEAGDEISQRIFSKFIEKSRKS